MSAPPELDVVVHDGVGEHMLLVHGFLSSRASWLANLRRLSEVARPVTVELWGHGRSPAPADPEWYGAEGYVAAFERVREAVGCERWFVCGHSLGAALTLRYALDHPDRVIGHVMMNSSSAAAPADWFASRRADFEAEADAFVAGGHEAVRAHRFHPGNARGLGADVAEALAADTVLHDIGGLSRSVRHTTGTTSSRDRLGENVVPTLLVAGERERAFAPIREVLEAQLPHLEVVGLPGVGHAVNMEAPDAFGDAVTRFVSALSAAGDRRRG